MAWPLRMCRVWPRHARRECDSDVGGLSALSDWVDCGRRLSGRIVVASSPGSTGRPSRWPRWRTSDTSGPLAGRAAGAQPVAECRPPSLLQAEKCRYHGPLSGALVPACRASIAGQGIPLTRRDRRPELSLFRTESPVSSTPVIPPSSPCCMLLVPWPRLRVVRPTSSPYCCKPPAADTGGPRRLLRGSSASELRLTPPASFRGPRPRAV
jgi:hypothetical protein